MKGVTVLFTKETTVAQIARFLAGLSMYMNKFCAVIIIDEENIDIMLPNEENPQLVIPVKQGYDTSTSVLLKYIAEYLDLDYNKAVVPCIVGIML